MGTENNQLSFVVHWLNNKELHFTLESEKLLEKLSSNNSELYEEESNGDLQVDVHVHFIYFMFKYPISIFLKI